MTELPSDEVIRCLTTACARLSSALANSKENLSGGALHRYRSRLWLKELAEVLEGNGTTTSREKTKNEFLFDIVVVENPLEAKSFFGKRIWAVESEFARRTKEVSRDLAKLTWAAADNRLLIISKSDPLKTHLRSLSESISIQAGTLFVAHMPHPEHWTEKKIGGELWQFVKGRWNEHAGTF